MLSSKSTVAFLILIVVLASVAVQVPLHNRSAILNDEGFHCGFAENILEGKVIFRDFPSYVLPGVFYFLALLFKIFGVSLLVSRCAMAVVFSLAAVLVFLISRHLMTLWLAFAVSLVFVFHRVWAFPIWNMIGYATFAMFLIGFALFLLMQFNRNPRLATVFLAGAFIAAAAIFKQDYGVFAGAGVFLYLFLWPRLRSRAEAEPVPEMTRAKVALLYILGGAAVCIPMLAYFWHKGALDDLVLNTVIFPLSMETSRDTTRLIPLWPLFRQDEFVRQNLYMYAPSVGFVRTLLNYHRGQPSGFIFTNTALLDVLLKLVHYSPYVVLLAAGAVLARKFQKREHSPRLENMTVVWLVALLIILTQHRPFDYAHLMQMYLPIFLLVGCLFEALYERIPKRGRLYYSISGVLGLLFILYVQQSVSAIHFLATAYSAKLEGPRAGVYMEPRERDTVSRAIHYIQERTTPEEPIFVLPYHSLFYFLSERHNPTRFNVLWPVKVFPDTDEEIISILEAKQVRYLVFSPTLDPSVGPLEEIAPKIARYIEYRYSIEKVFGDRNRGICFIILKRKNALGT